MFNNSPILKKYSYFPAHEDLYDDACDCFWPWEMKLRIKMQINFKNHTYHSNTIKEASKTSATFSAP